MHQVLSVAKKLTCLDLGDLDLSFTNGYEVTSLDLGYPIARVVSSSRVGDAGERDRTVLTGGRVVSMTVACWAREDGSATRREVLERLRAYSAPGRRPSLVFCEDDGEERRVVLRGETPEWVMTPEGNSLPLSMYFTAPSGLLETVEAIIVTAPAAAAPQPGLSYPRAYPRRYPATTIIGTSAVVAGDRFSVPVDHITQLWGPCTGPRLVNVTTGGVLALPGLVLGADQYAEVDTAAASIRLNGRPAESLYAWQQWGISSFWRLAPGVNAVRYAPDAYDGEARAVITYRPATF